jgi:hypothetical protein
MQPGFHNLPFNLVDNCEEPHTLERRGPLPCRSFRTAFVAKPRNPSGTSSARAAPTDSRQRDESATRAYKRRRPGTEDCVIFLALILAIVTAIVTVPPSTTAVYQKLYWLLLIESTPEWIATAGAIDGHLPVSP